MKRQVIFVAMAYSAETPDRVHLNVSKALAVGRALMNKGHIPVVPHLSHFWHLEMLSRFGHSFSYEEWMRYTLALVERCDSLLHHESPGADRELARAEELGLTIYRSLTEVPDEVRDC